MDRSRLFLLLPGEAYGMLDLGERKDQDRLIDLMHGVGPELVVVDSLSSISARGENCVEDVRAVLGFLGSVAREFDVGLLLIHHLRKRGRGPGEGDGLTPDAFRGSGHIVAMARSVLGMELVQAGPAVDRNGSRRLEVVKTNLVRYPPALGVVFEERAGAPCLRFGEAPRGYGEVTQEEGCVEWLVGMLAEAGEPVRPRDVVAMAEAAGFLRGVVYRARGRLEGVVVDTEGRFSPRNRWALAPAGNCSTVLPFHDG